MVVQCMVENQFFFYISIVYIKRAEGIFNQLDFEDVHFATSIRIYIVYQD